MNQFQQDERTKTNRSVAVRVSALSVAINVLLAAFKLVFGLYAHSEALISDAANSATDVFFTLIVMGGVILSSRDSDHDHTYGHERLESIASILLAVILFAVGAGIGYRGILKALSSARGAEPLPGIAALVAAAVSAVIKLFMFRYTKAAAKKTNSSALLADAYNHRSDVLASAGGFLGILAARLGLPVMDPLAAVVICLFILRAAFSVFKDAMNKLVDKSCDPATQQKMKEVILSTPGVIRVDEIKTRLFGPRIYVDIEIVCDGELTLHASHEIAEDVHRRIEEEFAAVKHCMVHVNPDS
ncbi:MAG: cation diffusion facilitator family transporter [Christensenellales bacterium]|jgi:cation diffusion facilitator family transporter